jgi:hypothetical protein
MSGFFPSQTGAWARIEEPPVLRRLSMSVVEVGVATGVLLHVFRAAALSRPGSSWLFISVSFVFGMVLLLGMATLHLGNFTVRHWIWRAPAFAAIEGATEGVVSLLLIAIGKEPLGASRATFADWPALAASIFFWRMLAVSIFALVLAGVVQLVRVFWLRHEHRDHTLEAIHQTAKPQG